MEIFVAGLEDGGRLSVFREEPMTSSDWERVRTAKLDPASQFEGAIRCLMDMGYDARFVSGVRRRRLPDERLGPKLHFVVHSTRIEGDSYVPYDVDGYLQAGEYEDGTLGEIFLVVGKPGSEMALYDQWAIAFSLLLQSGWDVDVLCDKWVNQRFEPSGPTSVPEVPRCTSIVDLVCRRLRKRYGRMSAPSALVVRDGRVLLARRPAGKSFGGMWETPGGKSEPKESDEVALQRELFEELGVLAQIGPPIHEARLDPPVTSRRYRIPFHLVEIVGEPKAFASSEIRWFSLDEAAALELTPASKEMLVARRDLAAAAGIR